MSLAAVSAGAKATLVMFICNHCPYVVMLKGACVMKGINACVT